MIKKDLIVQIGDEILRKVAVDIPLEKISSNEIQNIITEMKNILDKEDEGVALAAPQIGKSLNIFIISEKAYLIENKKIRNLVFINPQIIKNSKKKKYLEEGCLSIRGKFGEVERHEKTNIEAFDENGNKFTQNGSKLFSQIFQHEIDHLNGIMFVDKVRNLKNI